MANNNVGMRDKLGYEKFAQVFLSEMQRCALENDKVGMGRLEDMLDAYGNKLRFLGRHLDQETIDKMGYHEAMAYEVEVDELGEFVKLVDTLSEIRPLLIHGDKGNGKSMTISKYAKSHDLEKYVVNNAITPYDFMGSLLPNGEYKYSPMEKAFKDGGVLVFEEFDAYDTNAMLYLNDALETKRITLKNGEIIEGHKDLRIFATSNTSGNGATREYSGRNMMDGALLDRFIKLEMGEFKQIHMLICDNDKKLYDEITHFLDEHELSHSARNYDKVARLLKKLSMSKLLELVDEKRILEI